MGDLKIGVRHLFLILALFSQEAFARGGGGCFTAETSILMSDQSTLPISKLAVNDEVLAFNLDGTTTRSKVVDLFSFDVDEYYELHTQSGVNAQVTAEHPFFVGNSTFKMVKDLQVGDPIYIYRDGTRADSIQSIQLVKKNVRVYNFHTDLPHTYFANGIAVHNKGGGGGRGGGRGGSSRPLYIYFHGNRYNVDFLWIIGFLFMFFHKMKDTLKGGAMI